MAIGERKLETSGQTSGSIDASSGNLKLATSLIAKNAMMSKSIV